MGEEKEIGDGGLEMGQSLEIGDWSAHYILNSPPPILYPLPSTLHSTLTFPPLLSILVQFFHTIGYAVGNSVEAEAAPQLYVNRAAQVTAP